MINRLSLLAPALALVALLTAGTAHAAVFYSNPWGNAPTSILIGRSGGFNRIVYRRHSDGKCTDRIFGNTQQTGLESDTYIYGGDGDDVIWVVENGTTVSLCGMTLSQTRFGSFYDMLVFSRRGFDVMVGDKNAWLYAESGAADIVATRNFASVTAGSNWLFALSGVAQLSGGVQDDLFCNMSGEPTFWDAYGSDGTDTIWGSARTETSIEVHLPASDTTCGTAWYATMAYVTQVW